MGIPTTMMKMKIEKIIQRCCCILIGSYGLSKKFSEPK